MAARSQEVKLIKSDGRRLEVRDVGAVIYELAATAIPIKAHGYFLLDDDAARRWVGELIAAQKQPLPTEPKE